MSNYCECVKNIEGMFEEASEFALCIENVFDEAEKLIEDCKVVPLATGGVSRKQMLTVIASAVVSVARDDYEVGKKTQETKKIVKEVVIHKRKCPECGKHTVIVLPLTNSFVVACDTCDYQVKCEKVTFED